jgi:hypothetical protein
MQGKEVVKDPSDPSGRQTQGVSDLSKAAQSRIVSPPLEELNTFEGNGGLLCE